MSALLRPLQWFYHEFGVASVHHTGRNAYLIIMARTSRMVAFGCNSLILGQLVMLLSTQSSGVHRATTG